MDFPVIKTSILIGILGTFSQIPVFYSSQLSLISCSYLFWQMKDLEVLYSSLQLGIFLSSNFLLQSLLASGINWIWTDSVPLKYEVLIFSLFLKYHKKIAPIWKEPLNLFLISPLILLSSFRKILLSVVSERISDLIVPKVSQMLYSTSKKKSYESQVEKLAELGFDRAKAQEALELHGGNLDQAATFLLSS